MKPEDRLAVWEDLAEEVMACQLCPRCRTRLNPIPGEGSLSAEVLFIIEMPDELEDAEGLPLAGRIGWQFDELMALAGLKRHEVFVTHLVKCRAGEPSPAEIDACRAYLERQIALVDPLIVAPVGRFSAAAFLPYAPLHESHGLRHVQDGRLIFPLFHPAVLLKNEALRPVMDEDFRRLGQLLKEARGSEPPAKPSQQMTLF
jgi:uracil-DNA glycosylase